MLHRCNRPNSCEQTLQLQISNHVTAPPSSAAQVVVRVIVLNGKSERSVLEQDPGI